MRAQYAAGMAGGEQIPGYLEAEGIPPTSTTCLLYTSDAADDLLCVDLGGRRIIKKKKKHERQRSKHSTQRKVYIRDM